MYEHGVQPEIVDGKKFATAYSMDDAIEAAKSYAIEDGEVYVVVYDTLINLYAIQHHEVYVINSYTNPLNNDIIIWVEVP